MIYIWFFLIIVNGNDFSGLKGYFAKQDCPIR
jgi:hypothetical protein